MPVVTFMLDGRQRRVRKTSAELAGYLAMVEARADRSEVQIDFEPEDAAKSLSILVDLVQALSDKGVLTPTDLPSRSQGILSNLQKVRDADQPAKEVQS